MGTQIVSLDPLKKSKTHFGCSRAAKVFFYQKNIFLTIIIRNEKKTYFTKFCLNKLLLIIIVFYKSPGTQKVLFELCLAGWVTWGLGG